MQIILDNYTICNNNSFAMQTLALRNGRRERGWSQQEAARRLGVSQPYLALLERGKRRLTPELARRAVRVYGLSASELPPRALSAQTFLDDRALAADLANLGYPAFAHLRSHRPRKNPAETLLASLRKDDLEPRVTEGLPWLLLQFENLDRNYLVEQSRLHNLQNRLGYVVDLALQVAKRSPSYLDRLGELESLKEELERSRLAVEDTLCQRSFPEPKRRWLMENRTREAAYWHLLTDWRPEHLRYVS